MAAAGGVWTKSGAFFSSKEMTAIADEWGVTSALIKSNLQDIQNVDVDKLKNIAQSVIDQQQSEQKSEQQPQPFDTSNYHKYSETNANDAHKVMQPHFQEWKDGLDPAQQWAIKSYTDGKFGDLNKMHRDGKYDPEKYPDSALTGMTKALDRAMDDSPGLPSNTMLFRGFGSKDHWDAITNGVAQPGGSIVERQYLSTSPKKGTATGGSFLGKPYPTFYEIRAPQGSKGSYMSWSDLNYYMHESEYLLPRMSRFSVVNAEFRTVNGKTVAYYQLDLVE